MLSHAFRTPSKRFLPHFLEKRPQGKRKFRKTGRQNLWHEIQFANIFTRLHHIPCGRSNQNRRPPVNCFDIFFSEPKRRAFPTNRRCRRAQEETYGGFFPGAIFPPTTTSTFLTAPRFLSSHVSERRASSTHVPRHSPKSRAAAPRPPRLSRRFPRLRHTLTHGSRSCDEMKIVTAFPTVETNVMRSLPGLGVRMANDSRKGSPRSQKIPASVNLGRRI